MEEEFVPINDRVLVRVDEPKPVSTKGLLRPSSQQEPPTTGVVLEVGADVRATMESFPMIGRRIHWSKYAGKPITVEGEELHILYLSEVNGYFRKKEDNA